MAFDKHEGGHDFDHDSEVCKKCGMNRVDFQDNDKPRCAGKPRSAERELEEPIQHVTSARPDDA